MTSRRSWPVCTGSLPPTARPNHAAMEEWLLRCLRPVDPREWSQHRLVFCIKMPSDLTLVAPSGKVLGTFGLVERDPQLFFRGLVFE